jgi:glutamate dehydrogenase
LGPALDIVDESNKSGLEVDAVAAVYFELGEVLNLSWLANKIEALTVEGQWHAHARGNLRDELYSRRRELTRCVLSLTGAGGAESVANWRQQFRDDVTQLEQMMEDMQSLSHMDYATVSVAVRSLGQLVLAVTRT